LPLRPSTADLSSSESISPYRNFQLFTLHHCAAKISRRPSDLAHNRRKVFSPDEVCWGGEVQMRYMVIPSPLLVAALAIPAVGQPVDPLRVTILDVGMVSQSLRITMATSGLDDHEVGRSAIAVSAWLDGVPIQAEVPLIHMPARFAMELDLAAGAVRVAGITVGEFAPVQRVDENLQFPVEVTLRRGPSAATARQLVAIPLPTVVVPGYLNELSGPGETLLAAFRRHGYRDTGLAQTIFWFAYPSLHVSFEEAALALDAYVRQVVLPATYARKINVVGYSLGGLLARRNIAYDPDGWGRFVNRLVLVGVPNEGVVMPYAYRNVPSFVPYMYMAHTEASRAMFPTFPFWRTAPGQPWGTPPDGGTPLLAQLNARPIPAGVRLFTLYGSSEHGDEAAQTMLGVTDAGGSLAYGHGDGIVLAASAQGLPIQGGGGVASFAGHEIQRVNLGPVGHMSLLATGADKILAVLLDRILDRV
jgi:pimeloyl-ACP methyl ester carboxylesterase